MPCYALQVGFKFAWETDCGLLLHLPSGFANNLGSLANTIQYNL